MTPASPVGAPLPAPARILCLGCSTVNWTSYMGGPRTDMAYPRVLEMEVMRAGRPAHVHDRSRAAAVAKDGLPQWEREVVNWSPDVVVLHYGQFECIHPFLPRVIQRYAQSWQRRPGPLADLYWRRLVRPAWQGLAILQQRLAPHVPRAFITARTRRTMRDLRRLVERISLVGSPLVLLLEISPPGENYENWFPGMTARTEQMNRAIADLVADLDQPLVRRFPTENALAQLREQGHEINTDGIHYTPAAHRAIGEALAQTVAQWITESGHLSARQTVDQP